MQEVLRDGTLADECTWHTVVFIPKGKRDFQGIGLVEVLWKTVAIILNHKLTSAITFHHDLHGFRAGCGTGTAALEAKLPQQLTVKREVVFFEVFIDLLKAYNVLDREMCFDILAAYGVGPRML